METSDNANHSSPLVRERSRVQSSPAAPGKPLISHDMLAENGGENCAGTGANKPGLVAKNWQGQKLPRYVYLRRGKYLYFERKGRSVRIRAQPGTPEFDREYARAIGDDETPHEYMARKRYFGDFHSPTGECHFRAVETSAKKRATMAGREYSLPPGWMKQRFEEQGGKCALTGVAFHKDRLRRSPRAPSIDRIDSKKGYTPDNCQLITYIANCAKNQYTVDEFVEMCRAVVAMHGQKAPRKRAHRLGIASAGAGTNYGTPGERPGNLGTGER